MPDKPKFCNRNGVLVMCEYTIIDGELMCICDYNICPVDDSKEK